MKKTILLFCFIATVQVVSAQKSNVDSILQKVAVEKDENERFDLFISMVGTEINNDPKWCIETGLKVLNQAQRDNDNIGQAMAYSFLGQGYRLLGNPIKALD